jgi:hypothetical protein
MKELATNTNKGPNSPEVILLTYPSISESKSSGAKGDRFPMTGTIEEIGNDISKIKEIGIQHIVLGFFISAFYRDVERAIDISKQLMPYAK